jgi:hypothetical protein
MPREYVKIIQECRNCKFWAPFILELNEKQTFSDSGLCRRYPPASVDYNDYGVSCQPLLSKTDYCGEWKPKYNLLFRILQRRN